MLAPGRALLAEALGTALLLAIVVGSGIMGERLAQGNLAVALLANSLATGAGLYVLIGMFGPISGAHFNPVVSLGGLAAGTLGRRACAAYVAAQIAGALCGVLLAHAMFGLPLLQVSDHVRSSGGEALGEGVATFGLVAVILLFGKTRPQGIPLAVAAYITSAYWFTSSTAFANPAVTLARCVTDTFAGIAPQSVPLFVVAQLLGTLAAWGAVRVLAPGK